MGLFKQRRRTPELLSELIAILKSSGGFKSEDGTQPLYLRIRAKTANYTYTATDYTVYFDASGGAITATLPPAANVYNSIDESGALFEIKRINAGGNNVTVATTGGELIDGSATVTLSTQWDNLTVQSTGTGYIIL